VAGVAAGDTITTDWQVEVRGYLMGPGTPWRVGLLDRWSSRSVRSEDTPRGASGGSVLGRDLVNPETRILRPNTGKGSGNTTAAELVALRDNLRAAWATEAVDVAVAYQLGGQKRLRFGRTRDIDLDESNLTVGYLAAICGFVDADGIEYSAVEHSISTLPEQPGAGFTPPFVPPIVLPAGTVGTVDVVNAGKVPAPWRARITGPTSGGAPPVIDHLGTGERLAFTANGGLVIPTSQWADLDSRDRSVLLGGTADRRLNLNNFSTWFSLAPGVNPIRFTGSGTLELFWRDTW
jgi:hypothetical protein